MAYKVYEVQRKNQETGHYFFSPATMSFFKSKVNPNEILYKDKYFITEETNLSGVKKFSVREFNAESGDIHTVGEFHKFSSRKEAKDYMMTL